MKSEALRVEILSGLFYVYFLCVIYILLSIQIEIQLSTFLTMFYAFKFLFTH